MTTTAEIITLRPRRACDDSLRQAPIPLAEKLAEVAATRSLYQRPVPPAEFEREAQSVRWTTAPAEVIDFASHQASPSE